MDDPIGVVSETAADINVLCMRVFPHGQQGATANQFLWHRTGACLCVVKRI